MTCPSALVTPLGRSPESCLGHNRDRAVPRICWRFGAFVHSFAQDHLIHRREAAVGFAQMLATEEVPRRRQRKAPACKVAGGGAGLVCRPECKGLYSVRPTKGPLPCAPEICSGRKSPAWASERRARPSPRKNRLSLSRAGVMRRIPRERHHKCGRIVQVFPADAAKVFRRDFGVCTTK